MQVVYCGGHYYGYIDQRYPEREKRRIVRLTLNNKQNSQNLQHQKVSSLALMPTKEPSDQNPQTLRVVSKDFYKFDAGVISPGQSSIMYPSLDQKYLILVKKSQKVYKLSTETRKLHQIVDLVEDEIIVALSILGPNQIVYITNTGFVVVFEYSNTQLAASNELCRADLGVRFKSDNWVKLATCDSSRLVAVCCVNPQELQTDSLHIFKVSSPKKSGRTEIELKSVLNLLREGVGYFSGFSFYKVHGNPEKRFLVGGYQRRNNVYLDFFYFDGEKVFCLKMLKKTFYEFSVDGRVALFKELSDGSLMFANLFDRLLKVDLWYEHRFLYFCLNGAEP